MARSASDRRWRTHVAHLPTVGRKHGRILLVDTLAEEAADGDVPADLGGLGESSELARTTKKIDRVSNRFLEEKGLRERRTASKLLTERSSCPSGTRFFLLTLDFSKAARFWTFMPSSRAVYGRSVSHRRSRWWRRARETYNSTARTSPAEEGQRLVVSASDRRRFQAKGVELTPASRPARPVSW